MTSGQRKRLADVVLDEMSSYTAQVRAPFVRVLSVHLDAVILYSQVSMDIWESQTVASVYIYRSVGVCEWTHMGHVYTMRLSKFRLSLGSQWVHGYAVLLVVRNRWVVIQPGLLTDGWQCLEASSNLVDGLDQGSTVRLGPLAISSLCI